MVEPMSEEDGLLQEWDPETDLLMQIPLKISKGIFSRNLNLTCVDVVSEYIALGTSCGLIYWYCRSTNDMQRLHLENSNNIVTCVKIVSTVDFMVAAGTKSGNVSVFQIPKLLPESIPQNLKQKKTQIERFTIDGLHTAPVTVIEWSKNGMKLFSGDKNGLVVLTEIDFHMNLSKSMELLNEQFEIVQLSYSQQVLLISTVFRSIICDGLNKWKVHQVGTKERKTLGAFGATFYNFGHEVVIYASRPGHRLWLADTNGTVEKTLLFKTVISSAYPKIQLINPVSKVDYCNSSFGRLKQFGDKLIAYNSEIMYVLNPHCISIISVLDSARGIVDLAINNEEIFILEEQRSLLRIAYEPDKYCKYTSTTKSRRKSFIFDELASKLRDTAMESLRKFTSDLVITPERISPNSPPVLADEALNLPPIVNLPSEGASSIITENVEVHFSVDMDETRTCDKYLENNATATPFEDRKCVSYSVGDKENDDIISRPLRRRNPKKMKAIPTIHGQESESDTTSNASEDRLAWGIANELSLSEESKISFSQSQSSFSILQDIHIIMAMNTSKATSSGLVQDEWSKANDDKSQISLDTCESVSEELRIMPEKFSEEQERTFFRLANQDLSLLDSYDSEKTDNMSISFYMTSSSNSVSSKISENALSNSEMSEIISLLSDGKTDNSGSASNSQNDNLPLPKHLCFLEKYNKTENDCGQENKYPKLQNTSLSTEDTQQSDFQPDCTSCIISSDTETTETKKELNTVEEDGSFNDCATELRKETLGATVDHLSDVESVIVTENEEFLEGSENQLSNNVVQGIGLNRENSFEKIVKNAVQSCYESPNYDSPSGSNSQNCSLEPSSSVKHHALHADYANRSQIKEEAVQWLEYLAPAPIVCLAVSSSYVACIDHKGQVSFSGLSGLSLSWNPLVYNASWISVSDNARIVWILNKKGLFTLQNPSKKGPFSDNIFQQSVNVKHFAIDNQNPEGWVIKQNGQISRQRNLLGSPVGKIEQIPCDWLLTSVACWNGVVLALTSDGSVVCKPSNEERFRSIMTPADITNYIELGPDNLAWIVDDRNNVYFSDDFLNDDPHWWEVRFRAVVVHSSGIVSHFCRLNMQVIKFDPKILISEYVFQNQSSVLRNMYNRFLATNLGEKIHMKNTMVACNENSVWVFDKFSSTLRVNKTAVTGYMWNKANLSLYLPLVKWHFICASGISDSKGHFWLLSSSGDLFGSTYNCKHFQSVSTPFGEIRCISSTSDILWVLSMNGIIYCRLGLNDKNLIGNSWKETYHEMNLRFVWISCSRLVAWACDAQGNIYITIDTPLQTSAEFDGFKWLKVDGNPRDGVIFEKVFVGPTLHMVWAIDNKQNVYVREGISSHIQMGLGWVYVSGLQAAILTISGNAVWALSPNGSLYRRCGLSESNYIGDYWMQIPGSLKFVTSSMTGELWGIARNSELLKLSCKTRIFAKRKILNEFSEPVLLNVANNDWEMPEDINWSFDHHS